MLLLYRHREAQRSPQRRVKIMFTVEITYKSGKVEIAEIKISDYSKALKKLAEEGRLVSMKITSVC